MSLLDIQNLRVAFGTSTVVDDVSFSIAPGEKFFSIVARTVPRPSWLGLLPPKFVSGADPEASVT